MTTSDYNALAAYLHKLTHAHTLAAHFAQEHGDNIRALQEAAEAEQLAHWANGIEADLTARRLNAIDGAPTFEVPGLTDGPVYLVRTDNTPGDDAIVSD